jgi:hypothetical protein
LLCCCFFLSPRSPSLALWTNVKEKRKKKENPPPNPLPSKKKEKRIARKTKGNVNLPVKGTGCVFPFVSQPVWGEKRLCY